LKIEFAPEADDDFALAVGYLGPRNLAAAFDLSSAILTIIDDLAAGRFEGPESVLRKSGERVRGWPVPPYRIFYVRDPGVFRVVRIYDQRRRPITK